MNWKAILTVWLCVYFPTFAASDVEIKAYPRIGNVPHSIRVTITAERHPSNRELCLLWGKQGEGMGSVSCYELQGSDSKRTHIWYRNLRESGTWTFQGAVRRNWEGKERWIKSIPVEVIVTGGP